MMDINEFRTTWNTELFRKKKSTLIAARRVIRKSVTIAHIRSSRQLKYIENNLAKELKATQHEREILKSSFADHLQKRLEVLQTEMKNCRDQMKTLVKQEKDYWKELEQIIAKRTNFRQPSSSSNPRPIVIVNATFSMHVKENNENLPPIESTSPVKVPKIRRKNK